jgi:large subunit ribosomal protein L3
MLLIQAPFSRRFYCLMTMLNTILGSKQANSQTFVEGFRIPVTKVMAGPCVVTQIKNKDKDGYWAIQLGFGSRRAKNISKPLQGHFKKSNSTPRFIKEIRTDKEPTVAVGDIINASEIFKAGDVISVSAISKGKGYAGVIKKHGFHGGPKTHGQSDRERSPGSIGQTTTPGRVYRGKRMAGRMGAEQVTIKNLHVISVNKETNEIEISGQIPGTVGSLVTIHKIKHGSLKDLEHEVVAQVVEGEAEAPAEQPKEEVANA